MALVSRFDASELTQADGTVLESWPDLSPSNNPAVASPPRAPIVKTNIQNGKRGVLFDGVDDWMNWHKPNADKTSRLVAFKWVGPTSGGNGDPRIWESYAASLMVHTANNCLRMIYRRGTTLGDYRTAANTISPNTTYLVEVYRDRNNIAVPPEIWVNGVKVAVTTVAVESGVSTPDTFLILGSPTSNVNGTRAINAYILEVRFFDTLLTDTEKSVQRSQILASWNISGAVQSQAAAGSEGTSGTIPEILLSKDTVRGKISFIGTLNSVRSTAGPTKQQIVSSSINFNGQIAKKYPKRKVSGSLNLTGTTFPQLTNLLGTSISSNIGLSGRLIPAIVVSKKHHCKECIKRWAHRWFSRSD